MCKYDFVHAFRCNPWPSSDSPSPTESKHHEEAFLPQIPQMRMRSEKVWISIKKLSWKKVWQQSILKPQIPNSKTKTLLLILNTDNTEYQCIWCNSIPYSSLHLRVIASFACRIWAFIAHRSCVGFLIMTIRGYDYHKTKYSKKTWHAASTKHLQTILHFNKIWRLPVHLINALCADCRRSTIAESLTL